jgi:CheY-like chemotaxis protein
MSKRLNILAVDDDRTAGLIYRAIGDRGNFDVVVVRTSEAALNAIDTAIFDVILMDWHLRGGDGLNCTKLIREKEALRGRYTPIIGVTANAMEEHRQACLKAGMDDYLSKPFSVDTLIALIERWSKRVIQFRRAADG